MPSQDGDLLACDKNCTVAENVGDFLSWEQEALVTLLGKPDGGLRPITLRSTFRLYSRCRIGIVRQWAARQTTATVNNASGRWVSDSKWLVQARRAIADKSQGLVELQWGLRKAFEHVDIITLVEFCQAGQLSTGTVQA